MESRADLHVHSKHSDRPSEWFLRKLNAAECYTEPLAVYEACRARGMDYVTITDHDTIDGALEIAHLPGTFLSCEFTVLFPEDGCAIHCLVYGITEAQFRELQRRRTDLYAFCDLLRSQRILHAVAHPLFPVSRRFSRWHFEKLLLLFSHFEGLNGSREPRAAQLTRAILGNLDRVTVERLADLHQLEPYDRDPWRKSLTAGSDDHGGLYIACAHTETPAARTVDEFLQFVHEGQQRIAGSPGSSLELGRSLAAIAHHYYHRHLAPSGAKHDLVGEMLGRLVSGQPPSALTRTKLRGLRLFTQSESATSLFLEAVGRLVETPDRTTTPARRSFGLARQFGQSLFAETLVQVVARLHQGETKAAGETVAAALPALVSMVPYLAAFKSQHQNEGFLREIADQFSATRLLRRRSGRQAWFVDQPTPDAPAWRFLHSCWESTGAGASGISPLTCLVDPDKTIRAKNFPPLTTSVTAPSGEAPVALPPLLDIVDYCESEGFDEIVVTTPGPMGITGSLVARLLGIPWVAVHVQDLTDTGSDIRLDPIDSADHEILSRWQSLWLRGADGVVVANEQARVDLCARGVRPDRVRWVPPAVNRGRFRPDAGTPHNWTRFDLGGGPRIVVRGTLRSDSRVELVLGAASRLLDAGLSMQIVVVGEGPWSNLLRSRFARPEVLFAGPLDEIEVARLLAGASLSISLGRGDQFSLAVLEAAACGAPSLVEEGSRAAALVLEADCGRVTQPSLDDIEAHLRFLVVNGLERVAMASRALLTAQSFETWHQTFSRILDLVGPTANPPSELSPPRSKSHGPEVDGSTSTQPREAAAGQPTTTRHFPQRTAG